MKILVTGGAGYIGSHTCVDILNQGGEVVVVDNLSNSSGESLKRVESITGRSLSFYKADLLEKGALTNVFKAHAIDAVIHFAGMKAMGHIKAIPKLLTNPGIVTYNLGTGRGNSVLEMVEGFGRACSKEIPYVITGRRPGDIAACWADPAKAEKELGWKAEKTLDDMCRDTWRWQKNNPNGYK